MNVAHVIPTLALRTGGPPVAVVEACRALERVGVRTAIYTTDLREAASAARHDRASAHVWPEGAASLDVRLFAARPPYRLAFSPGLYRALSRDAGAFDVVHIHSLFLFPQFAAHRAAAAAGVPYAVAPRGALDPHLRSRGRTIKLLAHVAWQRRMLDGAAAIHVTSDAEFRDARDVAPGVPRWLIANGVRAEAFDTLPPATAFRQRWLGGGGAAVVMFMGRLSHKKGLDALVRAFAIVARERVDARLVIAGPDDEGLAPRLRALAAKEGIAARVTFTGLLAGEALREALAAADVWALPSHGENFGNAFVEAMAAGRACVVSPGVALAREATDARAAVTAEPRPDALATAIASLLQSPELRATLGDRARAFVRRYDWSDVAPRLAEMYESIARGEAQRAA